MIQNCEPNALFLEGDYLSTLLLLIFVINQLHVYGKMNLFQYFERSMAKSNTVRKHRWVVRQPGPLM